MLRTARLIVAITLVASTAGAAVKVEKIAWRGWSNCYRVSNGSVELIVTGDVGPRIMRYGFVGGQNVFKEFPGQLGKSGEQKFQLRGGHRVWKAPEDPIATWAPDDVAVEVQLTPEGLVARYQAEPDKTYPDFGCSFETFTNGDFLEIETLGPMTKVEPDGSVAHVERWSLFRNVKLASFSDAELDKVLPPLLR